MSSARVEPLCVAFLASAIGSLLVGYWVINQLRSKQWIQPVRYEDCPPLQPIQHAKRGTPTMGGLWVLGIGALVAGLGGGLSRPEGWAVLVAILAFGSIGLVDDLVKLNTPNARGVRCLPKLCLAMGVGAGIGALLAEPTLGYRVQSIPWLGGRLDLGVLWIPLAMVVIAGCAHAVNLTDGMDGLAVGSLAVAFGAFGLLALAQWSMHESLGHRLVAVWCASLAGACIGFLWFNSHPASVFLGDVGALGLGGALGVLAIVCDAAIALMVIGGVFVAEAVSVMLQVASYRWRNKRRVFRVAPLHHHFQLGGLDEQKVVVRFWIIGLLLAALGFAAFSHS